ncbi:TldD/PmbA family protein [Thermosphaera sp.]
MDVELLLKTGRARGLEGVEIYKVETDSLTLTISNDMVKEASASKTFSTGVRGYIGKRVAGVTINDEGLSGDIAFEKLFSLIRTSIEDPNWAGFPKPRKGFMKIECRDEKIVHADYSEIMRAVAELMEIMKDEAVRKGAENASVVEGMVRLGVQKITVANSEGVYMEDECTVSSIFMVLKTVTEKGESDKSFWILNRRFNFAELESRAKDTAELSLMFGGARKIESGEYDLILTPEASVGIVASVLIPAFSALNILEGRSPLKDKLESMVLAEKVTISDEPGMPLEIGSRKFDDEGMPTSGKVLVNKGVLKEILHNYYTSSRMKLATLGNGFRRNPSSPTTPYPTNFYIQPGESSLKDLLLDVKKGLIVYETIGQWMGNPYNGNVKATATHALLVENGEVKGPVKGVLITGNIYEWLGSKLKGLGREISTSEGVAAPGIWVEKVRVASE